MGIGDAIQGGIEVLQGGVNSLLGALGLPGFNFGDADSIYEVAKYFDIFVNEGGKAWTYNGQDWHKVYPYSFVVEYEYEGDGEVATFTYTLPIPPQTMLTKMIPASAVTPTLGGVVEETSDNVFWIIQMSGTTGIAVSRDSSIPDADRADVAKKFRKKLETTGLLSGVAAQLNTLIGKAGGTADAVLGAGSALASGNIAGAIGGVVGAVNNAILPQLPYNGSAVDGITNGFTEIQELHRFLYTFSTIKAESPADIVLKFKNYKTNQEWRVIIQDFSIQQSAQNPHLYRYNIQMKGWDVSSISDEGNADFEFDRFGPEGDLAPVNTVGAEGLYKAFQSLSGAYKDESGNTIVESFYKPLGSNGG